MRKLLIRSIFMISFMLLSVNCITANISYYVYDYTYDVNTKQIYDVFGWKRRLVVKFSEDGSKVYVKESKSEKDTHPYYFSGVINNYRVYRMPTQYRSDGVPYFPTISFTLDYRIMTEDMGDHTSFNTLNVYNRATE